ncbi:MAG: heme o synthase [Anaerolineae bacterium]|nr:heme o synthase [Anaerolineae bacterium]
MVSKTEIGYELRLVSAASGWRKWANTLAVLFKLRIVALLLFAAMGGAFLGAGGWPGSGPLAVLLTTGGMAASGASALNQYLERDMDKRMGRTRSRPLPAGDIARPVWVPLVGVALVLLPSSLVFPFNPALSFFLVSGAVIYVGVYTLWLKPRTILNIVIGGAAGSAAVLSGGAAVGNWHASGVIILALLIFLWTPGHFWSLAILYRNDYQRTNVPMLPAKTNLRTAAFWVLVHVVATGLAALLLGFISALGWIYMLPVTLATAELLRRSVRLLGKPTPLHARSLFMGSNIYLFVVVLLICLDTL